MGNRNFIKSHKIREVKGDRNSYERWNERTPIKKQKGRLADKFDFITEDVRANPDSLREDEGMFAVGQPTTPQYLMGEAVEHMAGRQKECYIMVMREDKSLAEAAQVLGISKGTVQVYLNRATKFITAYCKAAIERGRV